MGRERPGVFRSLGMEGRRLQVVSPKDETSVCETDFEPVARGPTLCLSDRGFRIRDVGPRSGDGVAQGKSPKAACPSISRASTGIPTCSLILTASAEPIVGILARSFGLTFCRSRNVLY